MFVWRVSDIVQEESAETRNNVCTFQCSTYYFKWDWWFWKLDQFFLTLSHMQWTEEKKLLKQLWIGNLRLTVVAYPCIQRSVQFICGQCLGHTQAVFFPFNLIFANQQVVLLFLSRFSYEIRLWWFILIRRCARGLL